MVSRRMHSCQSRPPRHRCRMVLCQPPTINYQAPPNNNLRPPTYTHMSYGVVSTTKHQVSTTTHHQTTTYDRSPMHESVIDNSPFRLYIMFAKGIACIHKAEETTTNK